DVVADIYIFLEELDRVGLALTDLVAFVAVPGTGLVHQTMLNTVIDDFTQKVDPLTVHDLEFSLLKRRRHLVLDHFDTGLVSDHFLTFFHRSDATDIKAYGRVELECVTTGCGLRGAEHD